MSQTQSAAVPQRNMGMDVLRIAASFLVVLLHTCAYLYKNEAVGTAVFAASTVFNGLSRVAVPLFVMLSGAFLLQPDRPFDTRRFYKKNLLRLAAAFLIWSFLYAVYDTVKYRTDLSLQTMVYFAVSLLQGYHHMWYLKMLMGLYLITPFLRKICATKASTLWLMCLAAVFYVLPACLQAVPLVGETASSFLRSFQVQFVGGYLLYYVAGYALFAFEIPKRVRIALYVFGAVSVCVTVFGTLGWSMLQEKSTTTLFDNHFPNLYLTAFAVFTACKQWDRSIRWSDRTRRRIGRWSSLTLGIYLVHMFIVYLSAHVFQKPFNPFVMIPVQAVWIYGVSLCIAWILKKIPGLRRFAV